MKYTDDEVKNLIETITEDTAVTHDYLVHETRKAIKRSKKEIKRTAKLAHKRNETNMYKMFFDAARYISPRKFKEIIENQEVYGFIYQEQVDSFVRAWCDSHPDDWEYRDELIVVRCG